MPFMSEGNKGYARIIKSTSIIGGAQGISMLIGMIRVKFIAVLIGPLGVGLLATYQSLTSVIGTVTGLGLQSSAVREIALGVANKDELQIARSVKALRRLCWLTGSIGTLLVVLLSPWLSQFIFNSDEQTINIALLGFTLLFTNLKGGQTAIIQGMRRIGDLAKLNVIGAIVGTVISVMFYWLYGVGGIIPALVLSSISELIASWWYARKLEIETITLSWKETLNEADGMVRMGLAFMWNGLLIAIVAYLTRAIIADKIDMLAVGLYTAAFALSGMFINFIMTSMNADFYPSLTAQKDNFPAMRKLVEQQVEVGLLLAAPGFIVLYSFGHLVVEFFYSNEFIPAAELLVVFVLGCIGRVLSNPLGYIMLALGKSKLFAGVESVTNISHVLLIIFLLDIYGLIGVAYAYFLVYLMYTIYILVQSYFMIGYRVSLFVLLVLSMLMTSCIAIGVLQTYSYLASYILSIVVIVSCSAFSFMHLKSRASNE